MDRSTGTVAGELREVEDFCDDALTSKGSVTVNEDRDDLIALLGIIEEFKL